MATSQTLTGPLSVAAPSRFRFLFAATIFLSAFLLFQIQLVMGKFLLPWFGGTPGVWTACMLVFQALLLVGYGYSHWLTSRVGAGRQAYVHLAFLLVSLLGLVIAALHWPAPVLPGASWHPDPQRAPEFLIVRLLVAAVGVPFILLATTGPLLQRWYSQLFEGSSPYRLYALSNAGSLLGLLSYPFWFERTFRLPSQAWLWSVAFVCFVAMVSVCSLGVRSIGSKTSNSALNGAVEDEARPPLRRRLMWFALAASASTMLLAITNFICQEVAVVPLLWVLPLAVYLLSFIICFEYPRWYKPGLFHFVFGTAALLLVCFNFTSFKWGVGGVVAGFLFILFACCMLCHGELYRSRPGPKYLTLFYLLVSLGGVAGGVFVSLIAPHSFRWFWELPGAFIACAVLLVIVAFDDPNSWVYRSSIWLRLALLSGAGSVTLFIWSLKGKLWIPGWIVPSLTIALFLLAVWKRPEASAPANALATRSTRFVAVVLLFSCAATLLWQGTLRVRGPLWMERNFFGILSVRNHVEADPSQSGKLLMHGRTVHGLEFDQPSLRRVPTTYYGTNSGIGRLLVSLRGKPVPLRVGVVGLGIGTLATYGRPGDTYRFYEINPQVIRVARGDTGHFSMLQDSAADVSVAQGDARLVLEREGEGGKSNGFDVLVIDAFNGDAIPVHLLTEEAMRVYLQHRSGPDAVLAFHITNMTVDLAPVLAQAADHFRLNAIEIKTESSDGAMARSDWVLLSASPQALAAPELRAASTPLGARRVPMWTDEYSNLFAILK